MEWSDDRFLADPYPGAVPPGSFVHLDGVAHALPPDLDRWLATHHAPPAAARVPVLTYGSNRCPSKITWLRRELGLGADPVVVLKVRTSGVAAVWAAGLRLRDGQRPAVLAAAPGVIEDHAVWLATPEQITVLDRCEGRDERFRLARLHTGDVRAEDGAGFDAPWCYLGHAPTRRPLLVDGHPVRCADVPQALARGLTGEAAATDGLDAETTLGIPHPDEWPAALFVYGLLRPGRPSWGLVEPHASGPPRAATVTGAVFDTGRGYPAWLPDARGTTAGVVVPIRDPANLLPVLDAYEGPDYRRVRVVVPADGTVCWAYAWLAARRGLVPPEPADGAHPA